MKKLKIGVFGAGRGADLARNFMLQDCEIVALCDFHEKRIERAFTKIGSDVTVYRDFDKFIEHDMDAIILANYFHEHAPYAIKCLEKGIHVFSECISNGTMAEGVELIRAAEKSNAVYMLAENYPQMLMNREMQRVCATDTLGKILYAEGEYNHPVSPHDIGFNKAYIYTPLHWRNYIPATYYITHSLGPIMKATGATPKRVTAFSVFAPVEENAPIASRNGDPVSVITTQNDDGSVFRVCGWGKLGAHHNAYRICGTNGQVENLRGMGDQIMLRYNRWSVPESKEQINLYTPTWNDEDEENIVKSGHGGSDYITVRKFLKCIKEGHQPEHPFDVHSAVTMSSVAILAHRSVMEGGKPYDIPDFRNEDCRKQYENDRQTPFYGTDGSKPTIPCCSHPDFIPTDEQLKEYDEMIKTF